MLATQLGPLGISYYVAPTAAGPFGLDASISWKVITGHPAALRFVANSQFFFSGGQVVVGATSGSTNADLEVDSLLGLVGRAAPGAAPAGTGYVYVNAGTGALHYKGSATDTVLAPA